MEGVPLNAPAENIDYSSLSEDEIYRLMVERSLMTTGDMTRMANVLKKAEIVVTIRNVSAVRYNGA